MDPVRKDRKTGGDQSKFQPFVLKIPDQIINTGVKRNRLGNLN